jgi:hypothetical protein
MPARDIKILPRSEIRSVLQTRLAQVSKSSRELHRESDGRKRHFKMLQDARQNFLRELDGELIKASTPTNSIFISYSGVGKKLGDIAKVIADEYGLNVKTGFDAEVEIKVDRHSDKEESLAQAIMLHIISCDCFLGIWSEDFDGESKEGTDMRGNKLERSKGYIPSVWMPFELGVAASHRMPFRLLVAQGTHRLYYEKPFQFQTQIIFEREEFETRARKVIDHLARKVGALRRR